MSYPTAPALVCIAHPDQVPDLPVLLDALRRLQPDVDLLVVDETDPEQVDDVAGWFADHDAHIHVLHRPRAAGLGALHRSAFEWGLLHGYDLLVEMDGDGSHRPEDLPALLRAASTADVVLGTRWMPGGRTTNWSPLRRLVSIVGNRILNGLLQVPIKDMSGGYRVFNAASLVALDLGGTSSRGDCYQLETAQRAHDAGLLIRQVPITYVAPDRRSSGLPLGAALRTTWHVIRWSVEKRIVDTGARSARVRHA